MTAALGTNSFSAKDSGTLPTPIQIPFTFGWPVSARGTGGRVVYGGGGGRWGGDAVPVIGELS